MTRFLALTALATAAVYAAFRTWEELAVKAGDRQLAASREELWLPIRIAGEPSRLSQRSWN